MKSALFLARVSAGYGDRMALDSVTTEIRAGAVTGLVGPNGAGKTTLLRVALGLLKPTQGSVHVFGKRHAEYSRESLAKTIAYLPQGADAHWPIAARHLVALGRMPYRPSLTRLSAEDHGAIESALGRCDAWQFRLRRMNELSAGERSRVLLARALATAAPILLVDEPAAHLDPAHQLRLMELLQEEAHRGTAVVVTLHDLSLASRYCEELVVLQDGHVAAQGQPDEALSDKALAGVFQVSAVRAARNGSGRPAIVPWQRL
ncbi:MAG: ABC transporter ATP-binding protein [Proteobacteria bacterium]|nr:ABC transporter ATP-binding protein [Pseudomonadota bacterium]